jgi:hypothetical protein
MGWRNVQKPGCGGDAVKRVLVGLAVLALVYGVLWYLHLVPALT